MSIAHSHKKCIYIDYNVFKIIITKRTYYRKKKYKHPEKNDFNTCSVGFKFFFLKKKSQGSWPYNNEKKVLITSLQKKKKSAWNVHSRLVFILYSEPGCQAWKATEITDAFYSQVMENINKFVLRTAMNKGRKRLILCITRVLCLLFGFSKTTSVNYSHMTHFRNIVIWYFIFIISM